MYQYAAIVSRELGLAAIVGTENATEVLVDGQQVTVSCAERDQGVVYEGCVDFEVKEMDLSAVPKTRTKAIVNLGNPAAACRWWPLPADGVGLAPIEFLIGNLIKIHPMALTRFDELTDAEACERIEALTRAYQGKTDYFVDTLARGIASIAAVHHPNPVVVRMSDFKTNEYAKLIGGGAFEPEEENPMLGWRDRPPPGGPSAPRGRRWDCRALERALGRPGLPLRRCRRGLREIHRVSLLTLRFHIAAAHRS